MAEFQKNNIQKIAVCLWFDNRAEEAAEFYTSVFRNSKIVATSHYSEAGYEIHGRKAGSVMTVDFELNGYSFTALNGGPHFKFNEAVSLVVNCETQEEVDYYWNKLSHVKEAEQCGWLKDKFGVSWQIVPVVLNKLINDSDKEKAERVMTALLQMKKLEIEKLKQAYEEKQTGEL